MNSSRIVVFILSLLVMQSCIDLGIYVSDFPIASPGSAEKARGIMGIWEKISDKSDENGINTLEFILFNDSEYVIRSGDNIEKSLLRAFSTTIAGTPFLNIQDLSETEKKFVFCKYTISEEKVLTLHFVGDTIFKSAKPSTSKKLKKFIKNHINDPALFNNEMKFSFTKIVD